MWLAKIGDLLPFLIFLGVVFFQFIGRAAVAKGANQQSKKRTEAPKRNIFAPAPQSQERQEPIVSHPLDDLLEALGQRTTVPPPQPVTPKPVAPVAKIFKANRPAPPPIPVTVPTRKPFELAEAESALKEIQKEGTVKTASSAPASSVLQHPVATHRWAQLLRQNDRAREAVIFTEIFGLPVGMRS